MVVDELVENIRNSIRKDIQEFITRCEETLCGRCYYDNRLKFLPIYDVYDIIEFFERGADVVSGDSTIRKVIYYIGDYEKRVTFDLRNMDIIMCVEPVFR